MSAIKTTANGTQKRSGKMYAIKMDFRKNWPVYLMFLPVILFYILFHYKPMVGVVMAFKDYKPAFGIWGSPWTKNFGFKHFIDFFSGIYFGRVISNTIIISVYQLVFGFPAPILLALMLNELKNQRFKKVMQTVTYFPHFISTVVVCGMLTQFCLSDGLFNWFTGLFGAEPVSMLQQPGLFRPIYVLSGIWQSMGWDSIVYLAAIAGIDTELYEAASLDGANRLRRIWHITLPGIKGTIVILLIMKMGQVMSVGSEKILLLYNDATYSTADVISTYVYRKGLIEMNYSFSTAVNLFNSIINFALVCSANWISEKLTDTALF